MEVFELTVASQLSQAAACLLLAGFIGLLLRSLRRRYLMHFALAYMALAAYLAASAVALTLSQLADPHGLARKFFSLLSLGLLFPHLIWLWMGFRGAVGRPPVSADVQRGLMVGAVALGVAMALMASFYADRDMRLLANILRISVPNGIAGMVYLTLALGLYREREIAGKVPVSPVIAVTAFGAFGLHLLYIALISAWTMISGSVLPYSQFIGLVGLILLMAIALSFVIWLLETEQQRAAEARAQARKAEQRLLFFRAHDPSTGLPNRRQVLDLLGRELMHLDKRSSPATAVLALGLHRYKEMSDSIGWSRTEDMMRDLARRISTDLPERFVLGRTGERDFTILMPRAGSRLRALDHARRIMERLRQPFIHDGREVFLKISGGLSLAPEDADTAVELIQKAERTQMQAFGQGQDLLVCEGTGSARQTRNMLEVEAELRRAQRDGEFKLHYQPLVSIEKHRITGFEALLRWEHPQRGILTPAYFVQDAAALGVLDDLDDEIFDQAIRQLAHWNQDLSMQPIRIAINVSAQCFTRPDLAKTLLELCEAHGAPPHLITLEITESSAVADFERGLESIRRLHEHGIKVSLDDFGTGYSALAHLQRLNVDQVKLDRSFVMGIEDDDRQLALTQAIVELLHSLGVEVLAEGIETHSQLAHMIECRVDAVQGFLLGKAKPAADYPDGVAARDQITAF